jgi:EAL domain-containing protein (putative c-di-GMP-specific phosphodiesterase class I)
LRPFGSGCAESVAGVIIQAIVTLGRALDLRVLVEGVETDEQRVLLRLAGCDEMQGFLFAKPAPASEIDRLVAQANGLSVEALAPQPA